MRIGVRAAVAAVFSAVAVAACSDGGGSAAPAPASTAAGPTSASSSAPVTSSSASQPPVALTVGLPQYPKAVTDANGRAVYVFTGDEHGAVTCLGACAQEWPPVLTSGKPTVTGTTFQYGFTQPRGDGTNQATWSSWPLYYFAGDTAPGQTNGLGRQAFGGEFDLIQDNTDRIVR